MEKILILQQSCHYGEPPPPHLFIFISQHFECKTFTRNKLARVKDLFRNSIYQNT